MKGVGLEWCWNDRGGARMARGEVERRTGMYGGKELLLVPLRFIW